MTATMLVRTAKCQQCSLPRMLCRWHVCVCVAAHVPSVIWENMHKFVFAMCVGVRVYVWIDLCVCMPTVICWHRVCETACPHRWVSPTTVHTCVCRSLLLCKYVPVLFFLFHSERHCNSVWNKTHRHTFNNKLTANSPPPSSSWAIEPMCGC